MREIIPTNEVEIDNISIDRIRIAEMRANILERFSEFFNQQGFFRHRPGSIIPKNDKSILFTGSTISTFKPYLDHSKIPASGFYMIQSCLRTQNALIINDDLKHPQWASYFSSIGALTQYTQLDQLSEQIWKFYTDCLGISASRLRIHISSQDRDLLKFWESAGLEHHLEYDKKDPSYYTHRFGVDGIIGRNCNIAIVDHRTGELGDIGNIIVIEKRDSTIGVEIAFGVETIVSRLLGLPNSIAASLISDIIPIRNEYSLKLADALSASVVILGAGVRPCVTNRGRVLRKYMQGVSNLRKKCEITVDSIKNYAEQFELKEYGLSSDLPVMIAEYIKQYEHLVIQGIKPEKINESVSSIIKPNNIGERESRVPIAPYFNIA